eukprot:1161522-Pelagomonas_calceolata.AAC.5
MSCCVTVTALLLFLMQHAEHVRARNSLHQVSIQSNESFIKDKHQWHKARDNRNKAIPLQKVEQKLPFGHNVRALAHLPRHVHLDLSQHVVRTVSRFRLRAHTLKVETAAWDTRNALLCDRCSCDEIQDEAHALWVCRDADVCALRRKYAYLFNCFSGDSSMEQSYLQQASVQDASDFLLQHNSMLYLFIFELMDIMLTGEDQSQSDQPNTLAEGPPA